MLTALLFWFSYALSAVGFALMFTASLLLVSGVCSVDPRADRLLRTGLAIAVVGVAGLMLQAV